MGLQPSRLRRGEIVAALSAVALVAVAFLVPWYGVRGGAGQTARSVNAFHGLPQARWLVLVSVIVALALAFFTASRRAPALPVTLSMFAMLLGAVTTLALIYRLLQTDGSLKVGAFIGPLAAAGMAVGGFWSLREEGGWVPDDDHPVPTVRIGPPAHP